MTINQAKRELYSYGKLLRDEEDKFEEIMRLKARCTKTTTAFNDMPSGSYDNHKLETAMAEMIDETDKYLEILQQEQLTRATIKAKIEKLEDNYKLVLNKRFILLKSVYAVANELHFTIRWSKTLLKRAIEEYAKIE